jgi:opacity protein-like surface antigen
MNLLRPLVAAGAFTLTLLGAGQGVVHAADPATLPPPNSLSGRTWSVNDTTPRNVFMSGWYLRADGGYRWDSLTGADAAAGSTANPTDSSSGNGGMFGLGAGFRYNWLRADATVDYAAAQKYQGTILAPNDVSAKMQTDTALINLYADLGTWSRFTPYIGAGIGTARVAVSDFEGPTPPMSGSGAHSQWNLAWAAMAGTAFAISRNLQVDVGYRYLSFGNVQTADGLGGHMTFRNLVAQEVRIGLRWSLDDLPGIQ